MTEAAQTNPSGPSPEARPDGPEPRHSGRPLLGFILLGVGALFAMHQLGVPVTDRWWTAIFLVLGGGALVTAVRFYRAAGRWTPPVVGALVGGVLLLALWARLFFGGAWHHAAGVAAGHPMFWHGAFFGGHVLLPVILLVVLVAFLLRRKHWQG